MSHEPYSGMVADYQTSLPGTGSSTGEGEVYNAMGGRPNEGYDTMSNPSTSREGAWHIAVSMHVIMPEPAPANKKGAIRLLADKILSAFNFYV